MNSKAKNLAKQMNEAAKLYDNNEYARGLKFVNKLLKQNPDHPELLGYKAIFLQFNKDPKGASECISTALKKDMKNSQIWKFNGIINKEQGEYVKSLQCFTQAHRLDPRDTAVLNDLCNLHLYQRNYAELLDFSRQLISISTVSACIVRYALALHLNGRTTFALKYLDTYESNFMDPRNEDEILFRSELYLFHATLLLEISSYNECITYLTNKQKVIRDHVSVLEKLAQCYIALNDKPHALKCIHELLEVYPENGDYFEMLSTLMPKEEFIKELAQIKSRYSEVRILELMDVDDPQFEESLKKYLVPYLVKGAPSIFTTISELSQPKLDIALKISNEAKVPLTSVPIVNLFKANVYFSRGDYELALNEINDGIKHTPTCVELYSMKLRIHRKLGCMSKCVEDGLELSEIDPTDRNSNILYVNSLLRFGKLKTAIKAAEPFSIDHKNNPKLLVTQFNDFHVRAADCCFRAKDYEKAIRFYNDVIKNFDDFRKAQFNYLTWGMRHISAAYDMLKWADDLPKNEMLARAFVGLAKAQFIKNDLKPLNQIALKIINSNQSNALAYAAVYFAKLNEPLPSIKCYRKCGGCWRFVCAPAVEKMMTVIDKLPVVVQEVAKECFQKCNDKPESFDDYVAAARGLLYVAEKEKAKDMLKKALNDFKYNYKEALDVFTVANNEMDDKEFALQISDEIHKRHPEFELEFVYEDCEIPNETLD